MTFILFWLPIAMVTAGTLWLTIRQVRGGKEATATSAKTLATTEKSYGLLAENAARHGDEKLLRELINARTQLTLAGAQGNTKTVKSIIDQLPQLTENQRKLNEETKNTVESMAIDFDLSWTATIMSALARFDTQIEEIQKNGIELNSIGKQDMPSLTSTRGDLTSYQVRAVVGKNSNAFLVVYFVKGLITPSEVRPAKLEFRVDARAGQDTGFTAMMDLNELKTPYGTDRKPRDGIPTDSIKKQFDDGFAKVIERFLVLSAVESK